MRDVKKLKQEQLELKEKLAKLVDFLTTEEYYTLSDKEKVLLNQQRVWKSILIL